LPSIFEASLAGRQAALTGRVIQVNPIRTEPRDFVWWKALGRCLLWITTGLAVLFYRAALSILRELFPRLCCGGSSWSWLLLLRNNRPKTQQVVEFFVHADDGTERLAQMKGRLIRGAVQTGHRIVLWGKWRAEGLRVDYGFNESTQSWFRAT
jgi:hypothetical protein